jgi:hypothetical protein
MKHYSEDINPLDSKGQSHGYQEWYYKGNLWSRANFKHGFHIGYAECHQCPFTKLETRFHIR